MFSQGLVVDDFRMDETDITANLEGTTVLDFNGKKCALIKLETTQKDFSFDAGTMAIVKTEQKVGEIWVYVPEGVKRLTISHPRFGVLPSYDLGQSLEHAKTYILRLKTLDQIEMTLQDDKSKMVEQEQINLGTIMVFPNEELMRERGYGEIKNEYFQPDYNIAFMKDRELVNVISNVQDMLANHAIPNEDMQSQLEYFELEHAMEKEYELLGNSLEVNLYEEILRKPDPDIRIDLYYSVNNTKFGKKIFFELEASNNNRYVPIASCKDSVENTSEPTEQVLNRFIDNNAYNFCKQMKDYCQDLKNNGREIVVEFRKQNGLDLNLMRGEVGETKRPYNWFLRDLIREHSLKNSGKLGIQTKSRCQYENIRIPYVDEDGQIVDIAAWAKVICKEFQEATGLKLTTRDGIKMGKIAFTVSDE